VRDNLQLERMRRFFPLARQLAQSDEGLSLMVMLLDDYYQQSLHAPPPQPAPEPDGKEALKAQSTLKRKRTRPRKRKEQRT